jgi:hypothetical protein
MKKFALVLFAVCLVALSSSTIAYAAACGSGTLAQVVNTTCTIGNLAFTFNSFHGFLDYTDLNNNYVTNPLDPNTIQFVSISTPGAVGFQLLPGWTDAPSASQWFFSGHDADFYYSVAGLNGALIYGESDQIVGAIGNSSDVGDIDSFDQQNYAIGQACCALYAYTSVNYAPNFGYYNQPYLQTYFADYGLGPQARSDFSNPGWHALQSFAYTTQTATVSSETLLYFTQTPVPEPGTLLLFGTATTGLVGFFRRKRQP